MFKLKGREHALRWLLSCVALAVLVAVLTPLIRAEAVRAEGGEQGEAWKNITLMYTTDLKGKIEPCG
jgi:hypothetical protein